MKKMTLIAAAMLISGSAIASDADRVMTNTDWELMYESADGNPDLFNEIPDSTAVPSIITSSDLNLMHESADGNEDLFNTIDDSTTSSKRIAKFVYEGEDVLLGNDADGDTSDCSV